MLSISWVIGSGESALGGNQKNVQLEVIMQKLNDILSDAGTLTVKVINDDEIGPEFLQVQTEGENSVVTLGEDDGEDFNVRSFTNNTQQKDKITILGNRWDPRMICQDKEIIRNIFNEFVTTGNVSKNLLN